MHVTLELLDCSETVLHIPHLQGEHLKSIENILKLIPDKPSALGKATKTNKLEIENLLPPGLESHRKTTRNRPCLFHSSSTKSSFLTVNASRVEPPTARLAAHG